MVGELRRRETRCEVGREVSKVVLGLKGRRGSLAAAGMKAGGLIVREAVWNGAGWQGEQLPGDDQKTW